jgi:predicted AlkP superfamily phosphohydrolase/phosphomutase
MNSFARDLRAALRLGFAFGTLEGLMVLNIESAATSLLHWSTDLLLILVRQSLGTSLARIFSSQAGQVLLHALALSAASLALLPFARVLGRLVTRKERSVSVAWLLAWLLLAALVFTYFFFWYHDTRFIMGPDALSSRGLAILFATGLVALAATAVPLAGARAVWGWLPQALHSAAGTTGRWGTLFLVLVLAGLTVANASQGQRGEFEKVETGLDVILIGVDAATSSFIDYQWGKGGLPTFRRFAEDGCWGRLRSSRPLKSPVAWTTIATGQTYQNHNVTDFLVKKPGKAGSLPVTSLQRQRAALWNIVSTWDEVGVINWWASWPAEVVRGVNVTSRFRFPGVKHRCYPPELDALVDSLASTLPKVLDLSEFTSYKSQEVFDPVLSSIKTHSIDDFLWNTLLSVYTEDVQVFELSKILLQRFKPDLAMVYTYGTDNVQHHFFRYHPLNYKFPYSLRMDEESSPFTAQVLDGYYQFVDRQLTDLVDRAGDSTVVMLVSDHGAGPMLRQVTSLDFNRYFEMRGWIERDETGKIDSQRSVVYSAGTQPMESRRKIYFGGGVESRGLQLEEFEKRLIKELRGLKTVEGTALVYRCVVREQGGRHLDMAIDLWAPVEERIIIGGVEHPLSDFAAGMIDVLSGEHRLDGVIGMLGGPVRSGMTVKGASLFDVTPTVLYLMGYPVGEDMAGRVLTEYLDEDFVSAHPVRTIPTYEDFIVRSDARAEITAGAEESDNAILERLRALGYIN